jgi:S-formylglutathione hydrolase FrmB
VLYLLRGHEREWLHVDEDGSRHGLNVLDVYERLLYKGQVGPMILVMPGITSDDGAVHGLGVDLLKPWLGRQAAGIGTGQWERYLRQDLLHLVDSHWRTLPDGAHRGVDGFSLGGAIAVKLAAKYPGLFRTAGAYDGTFFFTSADGMSVKADDSVLANPLWEPAFGNPRNLAHATANSAANLIARAAAEPLRRITWMIQYGPEFVEPFGSNFYRGDHLQATLARRGIPNALAPGVLVDGEHTWRTADRHMATTRPIHWQVLSGGQAGGLVENA